MADRIRSLLDAGIALTSELSLDALLQRLAETAAELTGARYAALGVIDPNRAELESFVTTGLDPGVRCRHRRPAARARDPRCADPRGPAAPAPRHRERSAVGRVSAQPSCDAHVPRGADPLARRRLREPVPDRERRRRRLHDGGPGARDAARLPGCRSHRERTALRVREALVGPARVLDRGGECPRDRRRAASDARPRRAAAARDPPRPVRRDPSCGRTATCASRRPRARSRVAVGNLSPSRGPRWAASSSADGASASTP